MDKSCQNLILMNKNLHQIIALLFVLLSASLAATAQSLDCFKLPSQDRLPVANVNAIIQDSEGYMWYGTAGGGICSDDGYKVTIYSSEHAGKGIVENDEVTCIAEGKDGRIWFGTRSGTYYIYKGDNSVHQVSHTALDHKKTNCIAVTNDGNVWVGAAQTVVKFSPKGECLNTLTITDNKREEAKEMTVDSKGALWITVLRGGLMTINPKNDKLTKKPWNLNAAASYIVEDTVRHCYWVGTWGSGIVKYPDMVVQPATLKSNENQHFGSEVYNMWIDQEHGIMWTATMDDVYAYELYTILGINNEPLCTLIPYDIKNTLPSSKKIINKLTNDKRGNIWVPGFSPHTFILSHSKTGTTLRRDEVKAMTDKMGYKVMVNKIACEGDYYWIYQNRTRLSLYHAPTGSLAFMATEALPEPLSTNKPLEKCRTAAGVWTCSGKRLIRAWHDGMKIHWQEVEEAKLPNYISALKDEGNGKLLIGTERQAFLYDYNAHTLKQLTDSVGLIQSLAYDKSGNLTYSTDPKTKPSLTDKRGHVWTLGELTLTETNPKTGSYRVIRASDKDIDMDYFTDITLAGDSICLGGVGAFCMIGNCNELDAKHTGNKIIVTNYDSLKSISLSTMDHLHSASIQFAYRFDPDSAWTELPVGENTINISTLDKGEYTLYVKATDEFGVWHEEQECMTFIMPRPLWMRWWMWCIYLLVIAGVAIYIKRLLNHRNTSLSSEQSTTLSPEHTNTPDEVSTETATTNNKTESQAVIGTEEQPTDQTEKQTESDTENAEKQRVREAFLQKVEDLVSQNLDNADYEVDDLCRDLMMSRMSMYRRFQQLTEITPSEYIRNYRLEKSCELLRDTDLSIAEVAYRVGFTSPQYFSKCFKSQYGKQPKHYRNESRAL